MNDDDNEFLRHLGQFDWNKPKLKVPFKCAEVSGEIELTNQQKKIVICYVLESVSKGLFEDCEEFWDGMSQEQIDEKYSSYRQVVEEYVEELKVKLLREL